MSRRQVKFAKPPLTFRSLDAFLVQAADLRGAVEVQLGELPLHFFWDNRGSDTTFVTFSGSASPKVVHVPAWAGFGTTAHLGVNRLLISDPSIILDEALRLAWYGGNRWQPTLQADLTRLITHLAGDTRVVLFGPSGGGFAALLHARHLPGATVIVSNPQTDMTLYTRAPVDQYLSTAWGIDSLEDARALPFTSTVAPLYARPTDAQVVYVQNAGDTDHVDRHLRPFLDRLHRTNRVHVMRPDLGRGHLGPDKESFMALFSVVCEHRDWSDLVPALERLTLTRNMPLPTTTGSR